MNALKLKIKFSEFIKLVLKGPQCYTAFYVRNLRMFKISQSVSSWQAFPKPIIMLARKAGAYLSEAPFKYFRQALGPTHRHQTRQERLVRDKRSSLLLTFVNYGLEKVYNIGPRPTIELWPFAIEIFVCLFHRDNLYDAHCCIYKYGPT